MLPPGAPGEGGWPPLTWKGSKNHDPLVDRGRGDGQAVARREPQGLCGEAMSECLPHDSLRVSVGVTGLRRKYWGMSREKIPQGQEATKSGLFENIHKIAKSLAELVVKRGQNASSRSWERKRTPLRNLQILGENERGIDTFMLASLNFHRMHTLLRNHDSPAMSEDTEILISNKASEAINKNLHTDKTQATVGSLCNSSPPAGKTASAPRESARKRSERTAGGFV